MASICIWGEHPIAKDLSDDVSCTLNKWKTGMPGANGIASTRMSEHQKHTEFLRHCLRYGESDEHQALDKRIIQIQRDGRCVQRAVWLMAILTALAVAGLGYPAILVENFPDDAPQSIINLICALGLASLICLLGFAGLGMVYRNKLNQRREESRQLVTKLLASRLGKPVATSL
jgi:hypothetical protein